MDASVRARDGEFLVSAYGGELLPFRIRASCGRRMLTNLVPLEKDRLRFGVSYDANVIDETQVQHWQNLMETVLLPDREARL